jgi:hypothetical protein
MSNYSTRTKTILKFEDVENELDDEIMTYQQLHLFRSVKDAQIKVFSMKPHTTNNLYWIYINSRSYVHAL